MKRTRLLEAYRDGELSPLVRWLLERRLRRDPELRRALDELEAVGSLLREADAAGPEPDLWEAIRLRLGAVDAARSAGRAEAAAPAWRRASACLALAALAATVAALAFLWDAADGPAPTPATAPGAVRWLDGRGHPTLVLRDDQGATIIWVAEQGS